MAKHVCGCPGGPELSDTPAKWLTEKDIVMYGEDGHFHCEFCGLRYWDGGKFMGFCVRADAPPIADKMKQE